MNYKTLGNKPERVFIVVKAGEAVANEPVVLNTADGMTVVGQATAGAALSTAALVGYVKSSIASGKWGLCQVYGFIDSAVVVSQSKASSDADYASASAAAGLVLKQDTINDAFTTAASVAASAFLPWGVLPASTSWASLTGATGTGTLQTRSLSAPIFLRLM